MIDCHVHTARCGHGEGEAADYVLAARGAGIEVITFTEHLPLPQALDPVREYSMPPCDLAGYLDEVRSLAAASAAGSPLVLAGVEADWLEHDMDHVRGLLAAHEFDLVLGSVHFVDGWAFDDPNLIEQWDTADVDATWRRYFEHVVVAARTGLFDAMAHPDLVKKFGYRPSFDTAELYDWVAEEFANAGVAIELSTAGLRKPAAEPYPGPDLLAACARAGVRATLGSDAHRPSEVAYAFDRARRELAAVGYERLVYFVGRETREYLL